jgi:hypothetical protein
VKNYLPPSRPSLTSYALETRGALRRLGFLALNELISNDLMPLGGLGSVYMAQRVQRETLDQIDLKDGIDAILGGGGESFWKLTGRGHLPDQEAPWWGWLAPPGSLSGSNSGSCLLESSRTLWNSFRCG